MKHWNKHQLLSLAYMYMIKSTNHISLSVLGKVTRRAERTFEGMPGLISYMHMYAVLTRRWGLI